MRAVVTVEPLPVVAIDPEPNMFKLLAAGVAAPESVVNVVGTVAPAVMVGFPETPSPLLTLTPAPAVIVLVVHVLAAVLVASPVVDKFSTANKSSDSARVGFPEIPVPLLIVIPEAGAVNVLPLKVPAASYEVIPEFFKFTLLFVAIIPHTIVRFPTDWISIQLKLSAKHTNVAVSPTNIDST